EMVGGPRGKQAQHWMRQSQTPELVIKTADSKALAGLPAGKQGRGRLAIHPADRDAAKQLVESVVEQAAARPVWVLPGAAGGTPARTPERQVLPAACRLFLSGFMAFVSCLVWAIALADHRKASHVVGFIVDLYRIGAAAFM